MRAVMAAMAAGLFAMVMNGLAHAGPVEDAYSAFDRGDFATMTSLLRPLAEQGDRRAQAGFIALYLSGHAAETDYPEIATWCREGADWGRKAAETCLGFMYSHGNGVPLDVNQGINWFQKAAEQGDVAAQNALGSTYEFGHGVSIDFAKAAVWYKMSAEQGSPHGMYYLGVMCTEGADSAHDYVQGYMWYRLALANFPTDVIKYRVSATQLLIDTTARMTPADIEEANRRVDDWRARHPRPVR